MNGDTDNRMNKMKLNDIQDIGLDVLKNIHSFCVRNNIRYSVYGGTMIGIIRHKGFIPWDDDIDIAMPRPDYERFIRTYSDAENRFRLFAYESGNSCLPYARVCDMKRTLVTSVNLPWTDIDCGVWVDIFPLDGASDDYSVVENKILSLKKELEHLNDYRLSRGSSFFRKSNWHYRKRYLLSKLYFLRHRHINPKMICPNIIESCKEIPFGATAHFCNFSFVNFGMKEYHPIHQFDSLKLMPFETESFYCISEYDEHLHHKYGDYMTLPPESARHGHGGYCFYWK